MFCIACDKSLEGFLFKFDVIKIKKKRERKVWKRTVCRRSNEERSMVGAKIPLGSLVYIS